MPDWEIRGINGVPGIIASRGGVVEFVLTLEVSASSAAARITRIFVTRNPDKLSALFKRAFPNV